MAAKKGTATKPTTKTKPSATSLAIVSDAPTTVTKFELPAGFKVAKKVTLPAKSVKPGESGVFWVVEPIHVSTVQGKLREDGTRDKPASVCRAVDMSTGEEIILIVGVVIAKNLDEHYPNNGYVNKVFGIENRGKAKVSDKYNSYNITELTKE